VDLSGGRRIDADIVVSNADPAHLYENMLPGDAPDRLARLRTRHAERSMGLYVLYFGARRQWPEVAHHTVWFGERHRALLDEIFNAKTLAEDF
jgi:phytoene desaturase